MKKPPLEKKKEKAKCRYIISGFCGVVRRREGWERNEKGPHNHSFN